MIHLQGKLPRQLNLAVSGGVDSVAALHFLCHNHDVTIIHVDHNEGNSHESNDLMSSLAQKYQCSYKIYYPGNIRQKRESLEEYWRNQRYKFFHSLAGPVITCHQLNDCVETWLWSSMHGEGKIIPYNNKNVFRPFRLNTKKILVDYAVKHGLQWVEDESNLNLALTRNYIRKVMMPQVLHVNPGIENTIKKKVEKSYD